MSLGGGAKKARPSYTGIQIQTSGSDIVVGLYWGANRAGLNLLQYLDFKAHKQKQKNGKGLGGGSTVYYTYSATVMLSVCEGQVVGLGRAWKDQGQETTYAALGFTFFDGALAQSPWGYMTTNHPSEALAYPNTAYVAAANYDLGQSASLPQHSVEVYGYNYDSGYTASGMDADCALVVQSFLTNTLWGCLYPERFLDLDQLLSGPDATGAGDSAYQTYCRAMSFGLSPALVEQREASEILERWCLLTNTAPVWTGYTLKLIPFGDEAVAGNGVTYLPATAVRYTLTDSDFGHDEDSEDDPVQLIRSDTADAFNITKLNIRNRANSYNKLPVAWQDQNAIEIFGKRDDDLIEAGDICDIAMAETVVALINQRDVYIRNQFRFVLPPRYTLLEPMDVVALVEAKLGMLGEPVRIIEIEEDEDDNLTVTAEEFPAGVAANPGTAGTQGNSGTGINSLVTPAPVNPPLILEPPSTLAGATPQVWAAVSGGTGGVYDPNWGGCTVYASADGGSSYQAIGSITSAARQGLTTSVLAPYGGTNPQAATVGVDLLMSNGDLIDVTASEAAAGSTLSYVEDAAGGNGEFFGYRDATLTGSNAYDLGSLYRNLYNAPALSHASGSRFARLDDNIFKFDLPADWIGAALKFKFTSFNIWGQAEEDISTVTAYDYTPAGTGYGGGGATAGVPLAPTGVATVSAAHSVSTSWAANALSDNVTGYKLYRAPGTGASFGAAAQIADLNAQSWPDVTVAVSTGYTYFVTAYNVVGESLPSTGANATTAADGSPYGFGWDKDLTGGTVSLPFVEFTSDIAWTLPAAGTAKVSVKITGAGPSAQTDFDVRVGGVSVGTLRFAIAATTATFIKASPSAVGAAVTADIVFPANINGMSGRMFGSIVGTR